jgi:hypothetical protein
MCVTHGLFSQLIMFETDGSNYHRYATVKRQLRFGRYCNEAVKRYQFLGPDCSEVFCGQHLSRCILRNFKWMAWIFNETLISQRPSRVLIHVKGSNEILPVKISESLCYSLNLTRCCYCVIWRGQFE